MSSRFRFKGSAFGVAGRITYPFCEIIEVQAASVLPDIGGYGAARSANFGYKEILRFDLAHTEVIGTTLDSNTGDPTYSTLAKSTVEGLNVMEMVTADRIVANLVSTCKAGGESSVKLIGSRFENLRIAGIPVEIDLAVDVFDRYDTHKLLADAYRKDETGVRSLFREITLKERFHEAPPKVARWFNPPWADDSEMPAHNGVTAVSLVRKLTPQGAGLECWGHVIHISGFGTIRLAEVGISAATRAVTMVQIDLGSPVGGSIGCNGVEDGGTTW